MRLRHFVIPALLTLAALTSSAQEKILDFPIKWDKRGVYRKFLPVNDKGVHGAWSCGQVAHAMIVRYLAMHHDLQIQGSHFYFTCGGELRVSADFDRPFLRDAMLPSLKGIPIDDPRVDPVADFVYRFCVAMRTDWWNPERRPWVSDYKVKEAMARYYGIDVSDYHRVSVVKWVEQNSWNALYERLNRDIDAGFPCELVVTGFGKVCHEVVITGYRKVDDHFEYTVHFGGDRYNPAETFRLDKPIKGWDNPANYLISWGIRPIAEGQRAPLYNTILQESGALDPHSRTDIVWNGREYAFVMPSGKKNDRSVVFQRIGASGRPGGWRVELAACRDALPKPAIEWGDGRYAVAWLGAHEKGRGVHFALLTEVGGRVLPSDIYLGDGTLWPGIAWSGTQFGLCYLDGDDVKLARINAEGTQLGTTLAAKGKGAPSIVWSGVCYAIACRDNDSKEVCLRLIGEDGEPASDLQTLAVEGAQSLSECRVAHAGDGYGVAFIKHLAEGHTAVAFCLADEKGRFLPGSLVTVSEPAKKTRTADLSFRGGVFYLTYRQYSWPPSLYLSRITREGRVMDTRWLVHCPNSVCHTHGSGGVNVVSFRNIPAGKGIEVVSCIVPYDAVNRH
jgi:Peptidase C10 family